MTEIDVETVLRAQKGDQDASRKIIEALHRPVLATIYRFLGPRWSGEIEDVAQDVFLKVFRAIDRFEPERNVKFSTWVYTFVRNHCFDLTKRRRISTRSLSGEDGDGLQELPGGGPPPSMQAENQELGMQIERAIAKLNEDQRMVFILREYQGLDYAQIAEVMGISEGTVKSRLHRAKEALRDRLAPYLRSTQA